MLLYTKLLLMTFGTSLVQLQELPQFDKVQKSVMMRRKVNETEIEQHRDRCVYTAVIAAADISPSCTGRLSCVSLWVGFAWAHSTFSGTAGSSMDTHCLQVKFMCILTASQTCLSFLINLNIVETDVLTSYKGLFLPLIIFQGFTSPLNSGFHS